MVTVIAGIPLVVSSYEASLIAMQRRRRADERVATILLAKPSRFARGLEVETRYRAFRHIVRRAARGSRS